MNSDPFRGRSEGESHRPHSSEAQRDEQVTICVLSGRMTSDPRISALDRKFGSLRITNGMDAAAIGYWFGGAAGRWLPSVPISELSSKIGGTDACFQYRHTAPAIGRPNHQSHYLQCAVLCGYRLPLLP